MKNDFLIIVVPLFLFLISIYITIYRYSMTNKLEEECAKMCNVNVVVTCNDGVDPFDQSPILIAVCGDENSFENHVSLVTKELRSK